MQTRTFTTIVLDSSTHTYSNRYESEPFASLVLSSTTQTVSIQFSPQHVNVLEKLIAELKAIESQQQADRLAFLNRELNQLQREVKLLLLPMAIVDHLKRAGNFKAKLIY